MRKIRPEDVMDTEVYASGRREYRARMIEIRKKRRLPVGPNATFHFENYETMLYQVQEMVHTERGGVEQIRDELAAYNPLVPQGAELVGTFMLEYEDPAVRDRMLRRLGGIEKCIAIEFDGHSIAAEWEDEVERTTPDGKTSSIHFLHFHMTPEQCARFKTPGTRVVLAIAHPEYGHMAVMPEAMREELSRDLA